MSGAPAEAPVEVGAHTASHQVLANLPLTTQRKEIASSKACLEAIMGRPVRTFAIPMGRGRTIRKTRRCSSTKGGFALACSNYPETVTGTSDVYQLPRFVVRDWTEARLASMLAAWWDGREGDEPCDQ